MNEVIKAMKERRSIRSFKPDMPPKADIEQIVEAGLYAASARGRQDVITVAVTKARPTPITRPYSASRTDVLAWNIRLEKSSIKARSFSKSVTAK